MADKGRFSFYHEPLRIWIKTDIHKFAISSHMALKLGIQTLRSYFKIIYVYDFHILPNRKVGAAKDHGKTT